MEGTFADADLNGDGVIDFAEYEIMVSKTPSILKPLTLNVSEIIAAARASGDAAGK